jgi:hypothetical protein
MTAEPAPPGGRRLGGRRRVEEFQVARSRVCRRVTGVERWGSSGFFAVARKRVRFKQASPTVFRYQQYRFFFFSREENRMHVHVTSPDGEAKIWMEPAVELALNKGLRDIEIREILLIIQDRHNEIKSHRHRHFRG